MFEQIYSINYLTNFRGKGSDRCIMACKSTNKLQIMIFDYFDIGCDNDAGHPDEIDLMRKDTINHKLEDKRTGETWALQRKITTLRETALDDLDDCDSHQWKFPFTVEFQEEPGEYFKVQWASSNDCLIFVDKRETFVVEFGEDGCSKKRLLPQLDDKIVHHIQEDPHDTGFYIICSKEYDQKLELEHSHRDEIKMDFERQVEPGIIKVFNMNITTEDTEDQNQKTINMRFVAMRDDEFTYDRCTYVERRTVNTDKNTRKEFDYEQELMRMEPHIFAQISSFSINWPFMTFSGMDDFLVVFDVNSPDYMHRIELGPPEERVRIE